MVLIQLNTNLKICLKLHEKLKEEIKLNLYHESGFADIPAILKRGMTFNFVIGGRGTGKTYGALKEVLESDIMFCLMRRTQAQLDTIAKVDTNPFKSVVIFFARL